MLVISSWRGDVSLRLLSTLLGMRGRVTERGTPSRIAFGNPTLPLQGRVSATSIRIFGEKSESFAAASSLDHMCLPLIPIAEF